MRDDLYISLKNLQNKELTDIELTILIALNGLIVGDFKKNCINYSVLCYSIYGRKFSQSEKETIKVHFKNLIKKSIIQQNLAVDSATMICDVKDVFVNLQENDENKREYYVHMTRDELHKIMNIPDKINHFRMIRLFLWYINSLHKGSLLEEKFRGKIGFMPQSYFLSVLNIDKKTIYKYNKILERERLLWIVHYKLKNNQNINSTEPLRPTNTYSRYKDKNYCNEYVLNYQNEFYQKEDYNLALFKQKYSQKLRYYNAGKNYPLSELTHIHNYIKLHNKEIEDKIKTGTKIDDTSIKKELEKMKYQDISDKNFNDCIIDCPDAVNSYLDDLF